MGGGNSGLESDRRPPACCPDCLAKIWWTTGCDPIERYERLAEFFDREGLTKKAEFYRKSIEALSQP